MRESSLCCHRGLQLKLSTEAWEEHFRVNEDSPRLTEINQSILDVAKRARKVDQRLKKQRTHNHHTITLANVTNLSSFREIIKLTKPSCIRPKLTMLTSNLP
jgi:hypothetical protein